MRSTRRCLSTLHPPHFPACSRPWLKPIRMFTPGGAGTFHRAGRCCWSRRPRGRGCSQTCRQPRWEIDECVDECVWGCVWMCGCDGRSDTSTLIHTQRRPGYLIQLVPDQSPHSFTPPGPDQADQDQPSKGAAGGTRPPVAAVKECGAQGRCRWEDRTNTLLSTPRCLHLPPHLHTSIQTSTPFPSRSQEFAQRSLIAYVRSVFLQPNKRVFDVTALPVGEYAQSLGLFAAPKLRFLKKVGTEGRGLRATLLLDSHPPARPPARLPAPSPRPRSGWQEGPRCRGRGRRRPIGGGKGGGGTVSR